MAIYALHSRTMGSQEIQWLGTAEAARYLGLTSRTLYRLIDEGQLPAYKFGRVIRLKQTDVDAFVEGSRIEPGTLEHLYPEGRKDASVTESNAT
jgi:excisionase family DNA binding protein